MSIILAKGDRRSLKVRAVQESLPEALAETRATKLFFVVEKPKQRGSGTQKEKEENKNV